MVALKVLFLPKMLFFCEKNADIGKIKRVLVPKGIFFETTHVCVAMYQISSLQHNPSEF